MLYNHYFEKLDTIERVTYNELIQGFRKSKSKIKTSSEPTKNIIQAIICEHPEMYYVDLNNANYISNGTVYYFCASYLYSKQEREVIEQQLQQISNSFSFQGEEEFLRSVHNYLVKTVSYNEKGRTTFNNEDHSLVGPLIKGTGVCEGIAKAYSYILHQRKVDNTLIMGTLDGVPHLWNVVNVNGFNYHVDVTNDISQTKKRFKKPCYFYYLITDNDMRKLCSFNEAFYCVQTRDNPFYKTGRVFANDNEIIAYLKGIKLTQRTIYFKYIGNRSANDLMNFVLYHLPMRLLPSMVESYCDLTGSIFYFKY